MLEIRFAVPAELYMRVCGAWRARTTRAFEFSDRSTNNGACTRERAFARHILRSHVRTTISSNAGILIFCDHQCLS